VLPGPATKIHAKVLANAEAEHTVRLDQVLRWLDGVARSPKERIVKDRLKAMIERPE
jgi:hypothetical protein